MSSKVSQKQALKFARDKVSIPSLSYDKAQYVFYTPWKCSDPHGPRTEIRRVNKTDAFQLRASYVASIALHYMDFDEDLREVAEMHIDLLTNNAWKDFVSAETLLKEGIRASKAFKAKYGT